MKKTVFLIILTLMTAALALTLRNSSRQTEIFEQKVSSDEAYLSFLGDEITSVDELKERLRPFKNLKYADLGEYCVDIKEAGGLLSQFPGVEFKFRTVAFMYGGTFFTDVRELDLSSVEVTDTAELSEMLPYFKQAKRVTLGKNAVPAEQRAALYEDFPELDFNIVAIYDVFGLKTREDTERLDLRSVAVDGNVLSEKLRLFPDLKYVDLHGQSFPTDAQLRLSSEYPELFFGWTVDLAGTPVDSVAETIDISNKYMPGHTEELKRVLPLLPNLKKLVMCDCSLSNEELAQLQTECPSVKIVWRVYMGKWSLRTDAVAFSVLIYTYNYRPLTTADIQVLKYCTDLQALDLGHQAINDISVIGEYLTGLRLLILADNMLTDLSPLAKLPHLHYLEFFVNNVRDLSPLESCTEMVDLNISYNHGITDITPLLNFPKLERLWLESTAVSEADVQLLRDTYPNAKIVSQGSGSIDQGWRTHERYYAMMDMWLNHTDWIGEEFTKYDD